MSAVSNGVPQTDEDEDEDEELPQGFCLVCGNFLQVLCNVATAFICIVMNHFNRDFKGSVSDNVINEKKGKKRKRTTDRSRI